MMDMFSAVKYLCDSCANMDKPQAKIVRKYCLHERHQASSCNACGQVCPQGAVKDGIIDTDKCNGCGLCFSACPAGAILPKGKDVKEFYQTVKRQGEKNGYCAFVCSWTSSSYGGVKVPCLMSCDESVILLAVAYGARKILLLAEGCPDCPQGQKCMDVLSVRVARIYHILQQFKQDCKIVFSHDNFIHQEEQRAESIGLSRRKFLQVMKNESKHFLGHMAVDICEAWQEDNKVKNYSDKTKYFPYRWYVLRELVKYWDSGIYSGQIDLFGRLEINNDCHGCGACADACPTGALQFKQEIGKRIIRFKPSLCTGCTLCQEICMRRAVTVRQGVSYADIVQDKVYELRNCSNEHVDKALGSMENRLSILLGCNLKKN